MKTESLIALITNNVPAIDHRARRTKAVVTMFTAAMLSGAATLYWLQLNPLLEAHLSTRWFWVRFAFIGSLVVLTWRALNRLGNPGAAPLVRVWPLMMPIVVVSVVGSTLLWLAPNELRHPMIFGKSWDVCSRNIAMLSIPIFLASVLIARQSAPTRLRFTGAMLGFFAGAVGAMIYSLHGSEMSPSFLMVWYVLGMLIPTAAGALLGPRLLAW
jgi:hypothetical protein